MPAKQETPTPKHPQGPKPADTKTSLQENPLGKINPSTEDVNITPYSDIPK